MFWSQRSSSKARRYVGKRNRLHVEALEPKYFLSATGLDAAAPAALVSTPAPRADASAGTSTAAITADDVTIPSDFSATADSSTSVHLSWDADGSALGYTIYQFENNQPVQIATVSGTTSDYIVTGLIPNTFYAFNLIAFDSSTSGATPWVGATTDVGLLPPTNFAGARLSDTAVQLTWTAAPQVTSYSLYEFVNGQPTLINSLGSSATSATVNNLSPNTTYAFNLIALDDQSGFTLSAATPWIGVSTAAVAPPTNFTGAAVSDSQVQFNWTAASGASGYSLYAFENGVSTPVASYGAGATSGTLGGLAANTSYAFNLVALYGSSSAATPWISVTTLAPLAPPGNFSGTGASSSSVNLQWSAAAGATGYTLYEFEAGAPLFIATIGAGTTTYNVTGLSPSTTYAFNLVAFNSTESAATPWIGVSTTA